ncbi:MAG: NAD-dependent epimerase/dehydratase family protein [Candidatus Diapherotrites archaeon]
MSQEKILVTGSSGFLGRWIVPLLEEKGKEVYGMEKNAMEKSERLFEADITNFAEAQKIVGKIKPDYCVHLAAYARVSLAEKNALECFETNVKGTWNVLEACRKNKVKGFVLASTTKVYGQQKGEIISEEACLNPAKVYATTKACAETITRNYFYDFGIPTVSLRNSNVYGPKDYNFSRLVPGTIKSVLKKKNPTINGDGTTLRDFIFAKDTAEAFACAIEKIQEIGGHSFNIASGSQQKIIDITKKIIDLMGSKAEIEFNRKAEKEETEKNVSIKKAKKILGWKPKTPFEKGIRETIKWYEKNP